jgi:cellobiose phosphorylase
MLRDGLDYILGVRPTYDGLIIDPCIPASWEGYKVTRVFRGATYEIEVCNPKHSQHDVNFVEVDGRRISGNLLPLSPTGKTVKVVCVLK